MHTLSITLRYRPIRIGWCVANGDIAGFRNAVRQSYTFWGGRYNPIIPVDDAKLAEQLVRLYRADILIDLSGTEASKAFVEAHKHLQYPLHYPLFFDRGRGERKTSAIVDIQHPVQRIYNEHYKNNPKPEPGADVYQWEERDPLADIMLCTYGGFPSAEEVGIDYRGLVSNALIGQSNQIQIDQELPILVTGRETIATLNRAYLEQDYVVRNYSDDAGFYIGHADDWADLVTFWNIKAAGVHVIFYDPRYAARLQPIRDHWVTLIRAAPTRSTRSQGLALWHREERPIENAREFGSGLTISTIGDEIFNGLNLQVPIILFGKEAALASIGKGYGDRSEIAFSLNRKPFGDIDADHQHFVLSVDPGIGLFGDERATLFTPFLPQLNEFLGHNVHFEWDKARAEPESLGIITAIDKHHFTLRALDPAQLIAAIFKTVGIEAEPSPAGLLCTTLVQQMGGLAGCRPFKIEGVRRLIEDHNPDQSFSRSAAMQTIRGQGATRPLSDYSMLYIEPRPSGAELTNDAVLGYLLDKGVFRAGLKFRCPSCQLEFWRSLDDTETHLKCEYCGHIFNSSRQLRDKDWAFRRSGLFGRNDHQDGAIPVTLTLQQLMQMHSFSDRVYCTAMTLSSRGANIQKCETDFVIVQSGDLNRRIQVVIGECKTRKAISAEDVANLKAVADAFPSNQFSVFICFSKLEMFTADEIALMRPLNDAYALRVILLTARELEPYRIYERTKVEFDINEFAVSFEELARVTHEVFFVQRHRPKTSGSS